MNPGYHKAHSVACESYLTLQKAMPLRMENLKMLTRYIQMF